MRRTRPRFGGRAEGGRSQGREGGLISISYLLYKLTLLGGGRDRGDQNLQFTLLARGGRVVPCPTMQSSADDIVDSPPRSRRNVGVRQLITDLFPATINGEDPVYRPSPVSSPAVSRRSSLPGQPRPCHGDSAGSHFGPRSSSSVPTRLSTRASELGRKLAEERAKNFELQSRLYQNEEKISRLERQLMESKHSSTDCSNNSETKSLEIVVREPSIQSQLDKAQMLLKQHTDDESLYSAAREKSREFIELLHDFYLEQETHGNQDVLWLFKEIKVRFDDLKSECEMEARRRNTLAAEWRNSLLELFTIIEAAIEAGSGGQVKNTPPHSTNNYENRVRNSRNEEMIQRLESRIIQLELTNAELEERNEKDRKCMQSEREIFELTREGLAQRIKYLELRAKGNVPSDKEESELDNMLSKGSGASANSQLNQLRNQVATLSKTLAESENGRAKMIEEFQSERDNFMEKYRRLTHLLKDIQNDIS